MYKYISIVLLMLLIKGESSVITSSNEPVIISNSVLNPETKLEILWENHIMDFIQLIDMEKLMGVGIHYMVDAEVLNFIAFLSTEQFKEIISEIESMTEFREVRLKKSYKYYVFTYNK